MDIEDEVRLDKFSSLTTKGLHRLKCKVDERVRFRSSHPSFLTVGLYVRFPETLKRSSFSRSVRDGVRETRCTIVSRTFP